MSGSLPWRSFTVHFIKTFYYFLIQFNQCKFQFNQCKLQLFLYV